MVKATSAVVLDVPQWLMDQKSARDYLGFLLIQYLGDKSLPSKVADDLGIVLPREEEISIKVILRG